MFKKMLGICCLAAGLLFSVFAGDRPIAAYSDVYDEFSSEYSTDYIWISIDGDLPQGRVSLLAGKEPDSTKDSADGKYTEKICKMGYSGGEASRAFCLRANTPISKDKWTKVTISFKSRLDGQVRFTVSQGYSQSNKLDCKGHYFNDFGYANYGKFEIKGSLLKDPACKTPKVWGIVKSKDDPFANKIKATLEKTKDKSEPVTQWIRTPVRMEQIINVKKDKDVTISFFVKGDTYYHAKM